ncbi:TPA: hypothetical protein QB369_001203 [Pasteurella multocida]|uniref:hypothetical protein n=1 Tax=Pasteurella multocida TaxID=747 RepID=UPI002020BEA6|nr:hypothetical protein [Pasteurella multocida]MCL7790017.1 hypothetical protein [Pasteurella multocida]HDR1302284.1 hypothetical protein [Pasteurella multocida]
MAKQPAQKKKVQLNIANIHVLSQLTAAHKATMACARLGLTVLHVRLDGSVPTLEVQHNALTQKWLDTDKAFVYSHMHDATEQLISTAQRMLASCRVIFSFPRSETIH